MPAAHDIERQIAVAIVIAVEEPPFLVPVQRVVGGIDIEDDLRGWRLMRLQEERDEQAFNGGRIMRDLVIACRLRSAQLKTVGVDLPATGAQFARPAASLPASTAMTGSWRNSSWSLMSS